MSDQKNSFPTLITGVIVGATIAYLFGTKSGKKVKDELITEGTKLLKSLAENVEDIKNKVEESAEKASKSEPVQKLEETVGETVSEIPQQIKEVQKKGRKFFFRRRHAES